MTTTSVTSGQTSSGLTITSGNALVVSAGGTISNVTIDNGAIVTIQVGGSAAFTSISSGGQGVVLKGGIASSTTVFKGGAENVYGSAIATTVSKGGNEFVRSGASVTNISVLSGATITTLTGAAVHGGTIAGTLNMSGGTDSASTITAAGKAYINDSATLSGATIDGTTYVFSGGAASGLTVSNAGSVFVVSTGITTNDTVLSGGMEVDSSGYSVNTTVSSGGGLFVHSGGIASGAITLSSGGTTVYAGGALSGGSVASGGTVTVFGGGLSGSFTDNGDVIFAYAQTASVGASLAGSGTIDILASATVTLTGSGTLTGGAVNLNYGDTLSLGAGATGSDTLNLLANSVTLVISGAAPLGTINGFTPGTGDQILLAGFGSSASVTQSGNMVTVSGGGSSTTLNIAGASSYSFSTTSGTGGLVLTDAVPCFLRGARLATPVGEIAVEELRDGDTVLLADGGHADIKWIGRGSGVITDGNRCDASPVIIRAGALADGVPHRDLHLTRRHCVLVDGVLIPAELLVNGHSVVFDDAARRVEYYHVELAAHGVLVANGAPAESFRDDGSFALFDNAAQRPAGPLPVAACAPVVTGGARLEAAWRRVASRAADLPLGTLTADPDLHLVVDGQRVDSIGAGQGLHRFRLRRPVTSLTLQSRQGIPASFGGSTDQRRLGVALQQIVVRSGGFRSDIPLSAVQGGVYATEHGSRWTKGRAVLPIDLLDVPGDEIELHIQAASAHSYRP